MLWSFAAANDPCDKVRVSGTGLTRGKNQYQLHLYRRIVKTKCPGVPVSPVSANSFDWNFFFFFKAHTCFISNWPLTLMHAASRENRRQVCLVTMLHEASEKGFFSAVAPHSVSFSIQGLRSTAGLDLCHWQGRFSPAQHTVGKLKRDSLSIYLRRPLPRPALQGF